MKKDILVCECNSTEHQVVIYHDKEDKMVYIHVHLCNYKGFWKRLLIGIKYAFGYKSKFGHWDEIILNPDDAEKVQEIVDTLKDIKDQSVN